MDHEEVEIRAAGASERRDFKSSERHERPNARRTPRTTEGCFQEVRTSLDGLRTGFEFSPCASALQSRA